MSFSTLPPEIHLTILLNLPSYDSLISTLQAYPSLKRIVLSYSFTIFTNLITHELAGSLTASRSILLHAIKQIVVSQCQRFSSTYSAREREGDANQFLVNPNGPPEVQLQCWLRRICESEYNADNGEWIWRLGSEKLEEMIANDAMAKEIMDAFVRDELPVIAQKRVKSLQRYNRKKGLLVDMKEETADIEAATRIPVSETEQSRILHAIYALRYHVDVVRLGEKAGLSVHQLRGAMWNWYETLWQLEGMATVYSYLKKTSRWLVKETKRKLMCVEMHKDSMLEYNVGDEDKALRSWHIDNVVLEGGIEALWDARASLRSENPWFTDVLDPGGVGTCSETCLVPPQPNFLRKVIIPHNIEYSDSIFDFPVDGRQHRNRQIVDFRHFQSLYEHGLMRVEGVWDDTDDFSKYVPRRRIADRRWLGFVEGLSPWNSEDHGRLVRPRWVHGHYSWDNWGDNKDEEWESVLVELALWDDCRLEGWGLVMPGPIEDSGSGGDS
ncbi:hypothetical protein BJ508DRAFT_339722 [Ascobolus immersus RN42]|uniref:F-box domain-containing protein n=1 Tax=Ascobolus immersus RN42 TaxID=1160509 RepID=A0A3N4HLQ4_ASCIM|nr:hypothetical protein BJ508DRAFT_339722 [Ascobolus immersus RN42]